MPMQACTRKQEGLRLEKSGKLGIDASQFNMTKWTITSMVRQKQVELRLALHNSATQAPLSTHQTRDMSTDTQTHSDPW